MPVFYKTPPQEAKPKTFIDGTTQTKSSMLPTIRSTHINHPVLICSRFWESMQKANGFRGQGRFGFSLTPRDRMFKDQDYVTCQTLLHYTSGMDFGETLVPMNAISLSIAAQNFLVGNNSFDFHPEHQANPNLTYQLMSDRVQATYHNEDGLAYLAGISFVMKAVEEKKTRQISSCLNAFQHTWLLRRHYPDDNVTHDRLLYGRDCGGKRVLVSFCERLRMVAHVNFNNATDQFSRVFCWECTMMERTPSTYFAKKLSIPLFYPNMPSTPNQDTLMQTTVLQNFMEQVYEKTLNPMIDKAFLEATRLSVTLRQLTVRRLGFSTVWDRETTMIMETKPPTLEEAAEQVAQNVVDAVFGTSHVVPARVNEKKLLELVKMASTDVKGVSIEMFSDSFTSGLTCATTSTGCGTVMFEEEVTRRLTLLD